MKRLLAIVCLLALLLCACAEPEPAHVQEPISQPEAAGQAAEASEKAALLSPAAARMADLTAADIHYTDFDVDALKEQARGLFDKVEGVLNEISGGDPQGFFASLWDKIVSFFQSLFQ